MKTSTGSYAIAAIILFLASFFFTTCSENPEKFTLGEEFTESQTSLSLIDTFSVNLSTVILDGVTTYGTGNLLIGNYRNDILGRITSHSYFQIGIPESFDVEEDDSYDSLILAIQYNTYYFGDTTKNQRIVVHQLTENIEFNENGVITSKTVFEYNPTPIGSIVYAPKPNSEKDTLFIRMSDVLGEDLFTKLQEISEILISNENFVNYFRGVVLRADSTYEGSIVGFNAGSAELILYTSREGETTENINYEFVLVDSTMQFNNIVHDFSSTQLTSLIKQRNAVTNSTTGGLSFLQGGTGLAVRVDFPALPEMLLYNRGFITKAELFISPVQSNSNEFALPSQLVMYESDKLNNRSNAVAYSTLTVDEQYHEGTTYSFNITDYLYNELLDSYVDAEKGFLIMLPDDILNTTFYRCMMNAQHGKPKLKIYYLSY